MTPQQTKEANEAFFKAVDRAMKRAAKEARRMAKIHGTKVWVMVDGKVVGLKPKKWRSAGPISIGPRSGGLVTGGDPQAHTYGDATMKKPDSPNGELKTDVIFKALQRAAKEARRMAKIHGTKVWVMVDGKVVGLKP